MKHFFASSMMLLVLVGWPLRSLAHGVVIESTPIDAFQIRALYESGDPMAQAQITVYAPDKPDEPWMQAIANKEGSFLFTPDPTLPGNWDVQIRQAGHGDFLRVVVSPNDSLDGSRQHIGQSSQPSGHSLSPPVQKWLTIAAVVWGFIGTALFFYQRTPLPHSSVPPQDALSQSTFNQDPFNQSLSLPQVNQADININTSNSTLNK